MTVLVKDADWTGIDIFLQSYIDVEGDFNDFPDLKIKDVDNICEFENGKVSFEIKGGRVLQFKDKDSFSKIICV